MSKILVSYTLLQYAIHFFSHTVQLDRPTIDYKFEMCLTNHAAIIRLIVTIRRI